MACFFLNVGLYIIFTVCISFYVCMCMCVCVCVCVCACVRACVRGVCVPGDITLSTAEMGFLESVFEVH